MKICVYGAGAIGGYMAVQMKQAGIDVSLIARGPHLTAIRENGLKLIIDGEEKVARMPATKVAAELGPQDEMGRLVDVPTPYIDAVLVLAKQMGRSFDVYPAFPEAVHAPAAAAE